MNKLLALGIGIVAVAMVVVGYAVYTVISPMLRVTVRGYTLDVGVVGETTDIVQYHNVTLEATLTLAGNPVAEPYDIRFYLDHTLLGSNKTDSLGYASLEWNATEVGVFDIHGEVNVP